MKSFSLLLSAALLAAASPAVAQSARTYDLGPVTVMSHVKVEPGQLDNYVADLSRIWRASLEDGKKRGEVISYHIFDNMAPSRDEGDLLHAVERARLDPLQPAGEVDGRGDARRQVGELRLVEQPGAGAAAEQPLLEGSDVRAQRRQRAEPGDDDGRAGRCCH